MRLIDGDALLKRYDETHVGPPGAARKLIEDAPTVGGWVSVKDRLPEEDGTMRGYLVAIGDWVGIMAFYDGGFKEGLWGKEPEFPVHHWMPLPEPPEEVSGDG